MKKFLTFDCETDPFLYGRVPEPFVWGCYNPDLGYKTFFKTKDFVDFIKEWDGIAYAHNGGKFDTHFLLDYIDKEQNKIMLVHGRIAKIKLGKCEIRDSFMNLPVPLGAYQKDTIDYKLFEKETRDKYMPEILDYLKGDCVYLYDILQANFDKFGFKLTLASTAFSYWKNNFKPNDMNETTNGRYFDKFSQFYYGGRVEAFQKGIIEHDFKIYDINSAYPYAMQFDHPIENDYCFSKKLDMENITKGFFVVTGIAKGCFPFRNKKGGLDFPNDDEVRQYHITGWELKKAFELNLFEMTEFNKGFYFQKTVCFKEYVDYFYEMKKEAKNSGDKAMYLLSKLYLNSLYGKFGQNPNKFKKYILKENSTIGQFINDNEDFNFLSQLNKDFSLLERDADDFTKTFYNVATAASITGFVRAYMLEHIHNATNVLYCDTDSIACVDMQAEFHDTKLGAWDCEGEFIKGAIGGKKMYAFTQADGYNKISSKGARLTADEVYKIAAGETVEYQQDAPSFSVKSEPKFIKRLVRMT